MRKQIDLAFPNFDGTTTVSTIKRYSRNVKRDGMSDPYPRILEILRHPRFEELSVVSLLIHESGGVGVVDELASSGDQNSIQLMEYYSRLIHALERSMNQGILKESKQITSFHILAAENVVIESGLRPHKTTLELPPLEKIDGLSEGERGVNSLLNKYDHFGFLERF
ncbi:MAG TPA: hypothetical protein VMR81_04050 [Patescibacteria group bacterium]|nr:hypothetical protein [Patescibacteria group bacterium]